MESVESSSRGEVRGQEGPTGEETSKPTMDPVIVNFQELLTELTRSPTPPPPQTPVDVAGPSPHLLKIVLTN